MVTKRKFTMTEPLYKSREGWSPSIVHLSGDSIDNTRITIYMPEENNPHYPARSVVLYGEAAVTLCRILDAWRVKLKLEGKEE